MAEEITNEDRIAMAEAYRVYQMLDFYEQAKVPSDFVSFIEANADLGMVVPFETPEEALNANLSEKGRYLVMYMCTFDD